jgi:rod shape determining protein RodA
MFKKYQLRSYNIRLVILLIVTSVYGIAVINSADSSCTIKQCVGLALSLIIMFAVSFIDYNWLLRFYWVLYVLNLILLVLVPVAGVYRNNAKRWIAIGSSFQFQPSELTKILLILFTAKLISLYKEQINNWKFLLILAILLLIPLMLVANQPDLSTTILIILTLLTIIFCAGLSYQIIGAALLVIIPVTVIAFVYISNPEQKLLKEYQRNRIMAFIEPENYSDGTYQQDYSVQAIGSGQLTGKGLNNDDPTSLKNANYIAEGHTDFIFAVIGEELGFVGSCMAIFLLSWIVAECVIAAVRAKDFTGRLICCGVAAYIAFQSVINISVVTQLMPNTGLPLPFFSYGLTSLVTLYLSMGIVLNVSLQRKVERDDEIFADDFRG